MNAFHKPDVHLTNLEFSKAATGAIAEVEAWLAGESKKPVWKDQWNKNDVRGALIAQQGMICAFCRMLLKWDDDEPVGLRTTVDHYRPKDAWEEKKDPQQNHLGYPWLAYKWANFILCCGRCNTRKNSRFPLVGTDSRRTAQDREPLEAEMPLFLDPLVHVLEKHFEVYFHANGHVLKPKSLAAKYTEEKLFKGRKLLFLSREKTRDAVDDALRNENWQALQEMAMPIREHAWMVRQILKRKKIELPDERDTHFYLVTTLIGKVKQYQRILKQMGEAEKFEPYPNWIDRILWALAVLRHHLPNLPIADYLKRELPAHTIKKVDGYYQTLVDNAKRAAS